MSGLVFKKCPDCGQLKPVSNFTRNESLSDGLCFYCRDCYSRRSKASYRRRRARIGKPVRERVKAPAGHKYCRSCDTIRPHAEWHRNRSSRDGFASYCKPCRATRNREEHLNRTYGLTGVEWQALVDAQGGVCAICQVRPPQHVDHDHETGEIRGITCFPCNGGLGLFDENLRYLEKAIAYLEGSERFTAARMKAAAELLGCMDEEAS